MELVKQMCDILVSGITSLSSGIGSGLSTLVKDIFVTVGENGTITGLSVFGTVILSFGAIALAVGLCRMVVYWVQSLGN